MVDSILNLVFRCSHRRLTRPITTVGRAQSYVACLECGKRFEYNLIDMRIEKATDRPRPSAVPLKVPEPGKGPSTIALR